MKFKLVIISFTLFFFNSGHAICVPRNKSTSSPAPHTPPNLKPAAPSSPKPPTPSSPAPSSSSSSSSPKKDSTPSSPAPTAPSTPSPQQSPSTGVSTDSITSDQSLLSGHPLLNTITSILPKSGGGGDNPAIKKICESTDYPDVCSTTLGPVAGAATDASSVLGAAIKAGTDFAKIALDTAAKLASNPATPGDLASAINDCKESYGDASYNFERATDAFSKKDLGTLKTMLSAVTTDVGDCQDAFEGQDSPLTPISDMLKKIASNSLALVESTHI